MKLYFRIMINTDKFKLTITIFITWLAFLSISKIGSFPNCWASEMTQWVWVMALVQSPEPTWWRSIHKVNKCERKSFNV